MNNKPYDLSIAGNISEQEIDEINETLQNENIIVTRRITKAYGLGETIQLAFCD